VSQYYNPPLQVVGFIGTRSGDDERGPQLRLNADEARRRLIMDGELVWIYGPRRHELAPVVIESQDPVLDPMATVVVVEFEGDKVQK